MISFLNRAEEQLKQLFDLFPELKEGFDSKIFNRQLRKKLPSKNHRFLCIPNVFWKEAKTTKEDYFFALNDIIQKHLSDGGKKITLPTSSWFSDINFSISKETFKGLESISKNQEHNSILVFPVCFQTLSGKRKNHFDLGLYEVICICLNNQKWLNNVSFEILAKGTIYTATRKTPPVLLAPNDGEFNFRISYQFNAKTDKQFYVFGCCV